MDTIELIKRNNLDALGKNYFQEAIDFALEKDFSKSYFCIKKGLDIVTCDCSHRGWKTNYDNSNKGILNEVEINYPNPEEYYFVKAFILSYEKDPRSKNIALESIEKYISKKRNNYGAYIKSKILIETGNYNEAYDILFQLSIADDTPKILYRMARIEEDQLCENGLERLFHSFLVNPTSPCCLRTLQKISKKRNLQISNENKNILMNKFLQTKDEWSFQKFYEAYLFNEFDSKGHPFRGENTYKVIEIFLEELLKISSSYIDKANNTLTDGLERNEYDDFYFQSPKVNNNPYYNDSLDMDQQDPEFWDNL